ncbi:uncharacterized protein LOC122625793 [Drosophila teissieri]|uniref:uncharacterized protein LOC122625793 n=1 Tax=Drosophila teissieri TaxID=7243 RepID=UPI001CB9F543|nr:uncharacterized protein LOC122625793 [Drosophila teissieri]
MSAQTSVEGVTATTGGHGGEQPTLRVASGHTSDLTGAVDTDSDLESVQLSKEEEEILLRSPKPGTSSPRRDGPKRSSEGMKAKAQYKAALRILSRLKGKAALSPQEKAKLTWAEQRDSEGRLHFANLPTMASTGGFANKVEESLANKRQRSTESDKKDAPGIKRRRGPKEVGPPPQKAKRPKKRLKVSEATKRHLIVALIDRSDEAGKMTEPRWKLLHARLVESLFTRMEEAPEAPIPTFDGAGWLNGVKILKCMDDPTRKWLTQTVCHLEALWEGAQLEVVDRELIPSIPKAKVHIGLWDQTTGKQVRTMINTSIYTRTAPRWKEKLERAYTVQTLK